MALTLTSPAFGNGETIPVQYTCSGENSSPALAWSGAPAGTKSFLLICNDPDAPAGVWHHWAVFDIPPERTGLDGGYGPAKAPPGCREGVNDFGDVGYGGPCPPRGHGPHHYHFRLSALDVATLPAEPTANCAEIAALAQPHVLASAEWVGVYERKA